MSANQSPRRRLLTRLSVPLVGLMLGLIGIPAGAEPYRSGVPELDLRILSLTFKPLLESPLVGNPHNKLPITQLIFSVPVNQTYRVGGGFTNGSSTAFGEEYFREETLGFIDATYTVGTGTLLGARLSLISRQDERCVNELCNRLQSQGYELGFKVDQQVARFLSLRAAVLMADFDEVEGTTSLRVGIDYRMIGGLTLLAGYQYSSELEGTEFGLRINF